MTDGGAHLLLVEDDAPTRRSVAANLTAHGYRIAEAGDVAGAGVRDRGHGHARERGERDETRGESDLGHAGPHGIGW